MSRGALVRVDVLNDFEHEDGERLLEIRDDERAQSLDLGAHDVSGVSPLDIRAFTPTSHSTATRREMPEITTPRELFTHELGDILYVERKLASETLPKLIAEVRDEEFKAGLEKHLRETKQHVANVEQVFSLLGEEAKAEKCLGFEGLKDEHDKMLEETSTALIDMVDLGAAARTENYEIAAYEGLRRMAKALGEEKAVELLDDNLKQEKEALREVEKIATRVSNDSAKEPASA